jgi:CDP-glucose 4,6-dehydratase
LGWWIRTMEGVEMSASPSPEFWVGKRVLITGHTGFKGSWLALMLHRLGADITGISLEPETLPSLHRLDDVGSCCTTHICDIRDGLRFERLVQEAQPEIVLHLAAQPLVRASYQRPVDTFATNVMGTAHLLDALRSTSDCRVAVMVTTDKVYENREWNWPYRETDALGGHDPYSASKAASEIVIASYRKSFLQQNGVAIATARAGNVIGGGDWSQDRLVPDAIRAWQNGASLSIRNPSAVRPWQHVLEPLTGYLVLAEALWSKPEFADAWNFGPDPAEAASVRTVIDIARTAWPGAEVKYGDLSGPHEAGRLSLETAKARELLKVRPRWNLHQAITRTVDWYRRQAAGESARQLCELDMDTWEGSQ